MPALEGHVRAAIAEIGPVHGIRMVKGYLAAKGIEASEERVRLALRVVDPPAAELRANRNSVMKNPKPYISRYFGDKLHIDQNEKLIAFGLCHVAAIDGYSNKIVAHKVFPAKNPVAIYEEFYLPLLKQVGIWNTIRVDHGTEWCLMLAVQEHLRDNRLDTSKRAYVQSPSTANNKIERYWPEINSKINYPIKEQLVKMQEDGDIDISQRSVRSAVSFFICQVANVAIERNTQAHNNHRIAGKGIPNRLGINPNMRTLNAPTAHDAVMAYPGRLSCNWPEWYQPLKGEQGVIRDRLYERERTANFQEIFSTLVSGNPHLFRSNIAKYIRLTKDQSDN